MRNATRSIIITFSIFFALFFVSSCGKNGEITEQDAATEIAPPPADNPIQQGEAPTPLPAEQPDCPGCPDIVCCDGCGDGADDVADNTPTYNIPPLYNYSPAIEDIRDVPFFPVENVRPPAMPDNPRICMNLDDNHAALWWLIYQLRGGILDKATNVTIDGYDKVEEGTMIYYMVKSEDGEIMMEVDFLLGTPQMNGDIIYIKPYNFTYIYDSLPYLDPVLGPIRITGDIECTGSIYKKADEGYYRGNSLCYATPGRVYLSTYDKDYLIDIAASITFDNNGKRPQDFKMYKTRIEVDGVEYMVEGGYPEELDGCFVETR